MKTITLKPRTLPKFAQRLALALPACLLVLSSTAQVAFPQPTPETRHFLVFRGGYTSGRFAHSTDDYRPSFSLFGGGGSSRSGQPVEHRFNGLLLGADFGQEKYNPVRNRTTTVTGGLDLLMANDQLSIGSSQGTRLLLGALHPHFEVGLTTKNWHWRGGAGLLLGRVGYYGSTTFDLLSSPTTVDTVHVVPTFQTRVGWRNWMLLESGYGANGLLGLANPAWQAGIGTGFGPHSPVAVLVGATEAESTDFANRESGYGYLRLEVAPATSPWRANGLVTFGSAAYGRVALQVAYRLPLTTAGAAGVLPK